MSTTLGASGAWTGPLALLGPILASSAYVLEIALVPLLLPAMQSAAALSVQDLTWVLNIYAVTVTVGVLLGGRLGDRIGAVRTFVAGALVFVAGSLGVVVAGGLEEILAARAVQGFGGGLFSPVVPVLLAQIGGARPGRFLSLWNAFSGLLLAVAPVVALPLMALFGWPAVFVVFAAMVMPALLLTAWMPSSPAGEASGAGEGTARLGTAIARLATHWPTALLLGYVALTYGIVILFLFTVPVQMGTGATGQAAWALGAFWAAFTLTGVLQSRIIDGRHARRLLTASPLALLAGFALFLLADTTPGHHLIGAVVTGVGFALGNATSTMLILRHAPPGTSATAASLDITCARLGSVVTVALLAVLPVATMFAWVAALSLAAATMARLVRHHPAAAVARRAGP